VGHGTRLHLKADDFLPVIFEHEYVGAQVDLGDGGIATPSQQFRHDRQLGGATAEHIVGAPLPARDRLPPLALWQSD
jgi:hypothetical protein